MASKALDLVVHPVEDCVHAVYNLLVTGGSCSALGGALTGACTVGWEQGHAGGITHGPQRGRWWSATCRQQHCLCPLGRTNKPLFAITQHNAFYWVR